MASRLERLAGVLVDYSTRIRKGDLVCIDTGPAARPLVQEVWKRVLDAGAHPHLRLDVDGASDLLLREGTDAQLEWFACRLRPLAPPEKTGRLGDASCDRLVLERSELDRRAANARMQRREAVVELRRNVRVGEHRRAVDEDEASWMLAALQPRPLLGDEVPQCFQHAS